MNTHTRVLKFLTALRGEEVSNVPGLEVDDTSHGIICEIFTQGNCGNLATMLSIAFDGKIVALKDVSHVVCKIDGRLYDIHGDVTDKYTNNTTGQIKDIDHMMENGDMYNYYSFGLRGPIV